MRSTFFNEAIRENNLEEFREIISGVTKDFKELGVDITPHVICFEVACCTSKESRPETRAEMMRIVLEKAADIDFANEKPDSLSDSYKKVADSCFAFSKEYPQTHELQAVTNDMVILAKSELTNVYDAIRKKNVDELKRLIKSKKMKALSASCTVNGKTLLDYAFKTEHVEIIHTVWEKVKTAICLDPGETPLHFLARGESTENVKEYLDYLKHKNISVDDEVNEDFYDEINVKNTENGLTPLHFAVIAQKYNMVDTLLKAGADVNAKCNDQRTPLHIAAQKDNVDMVNRLLKAGADVNAENSQQMTPLNFAVYAGYINIVRILLATKDINVNASADDGVTVLHVAVMCERDHLIPDLIRNGVNPNVLYEGRTAAQLAISNDRIAIANQINEEIFWLAYDAQYNSEIVKRKKFDRNANASIADILNHAAKDNNRSRQVCEKLGWIKNGKIQNAGFDLVTYSHATFWNQHSKHYQRDEFSTTNLPKDATMDEILYHAKMNEDSRSRGICVKLGWMTKKGVLIEDKAPRIQYENKEECLAAFKKLHNLKLQRQWKWLRETKVTDSDALVDILYHAAKKNNRSHLVCMTLGWMDKDGNVIKDKLPSDVWDMCKENETEVEVNVKNKRDSIPYDI